MVPRPTGHRAHHPLQPFQHLPFGWPGPNIQASIPPGGPGLAHSQLPVFLTVIAVINATVVPDEGPYQVPQEDHVEKFTEIWPAVGFHKDGIDNCPFYHKFDLNVKFVLLIQVLILNSFC